MPLACLANSPARSIEDVLALMSDIQAALPEADGVACFNRLYAAVTIAVNEAKAAASFASPLFLTALDVAFANLYFEALASAEQNLPVPRAWAPLFAARSRPDISPLQFALAGMNAHINRDLPVGLVRTFAALGLPMSRPSAESNDYDKVNGLLAQTEAVMAASYFTPLMAQLHPAWGGADDAFANWSVREARAAAWTNGATLWHLRAWPWLSEEYLDGLDGMVGFAGRGLLIPTRLPG
jgi:hypothetical protein